MLLRAMDFYETETEFNNIEHNYLTGIDFSLKNLLVKAHEKEIYSNDENTIIAKIHRDNKGVYPFSKLDFLTHKIQELVYPDIVPRLYAADFSNANEPYYVVEKIPLDQYHIAYNITQQNANKDCGLDYKYDNSFFCLSELSNINKLAKKHFVMVEEMKKNTLIC